MSVAFQVRLPDELHAALVDEAKRRGHISVSEFVRVLISAAVNPATSGISGNVTITTGPMTPTPAPPKIRQNPDEVGTCPDVAKHRAGVFCKTCGATP